MSSVAFFVTTVIHHFDGSHWHQKSPTTGVRQSGDVLVVWPWTNPLISLRLSCLFTKMGIIKMTVL